MLKSPMPFLRNNSDAFLAAGIGALSGQTGPQQAALAAQGFAGARQDGRRRNMTVEYLKRTNPQLAEMFEQGLVGGKEVGQYLLQAQMPEKSNPTSLMRNLEAAGLKPGTPEYQKAILANQTKPLVSMTNGPQVGSIPQGYELYKGPEGAYQMRAIKGGPEDTSVQDANREQARSTSANIVLDEIDIAKQIVQSNPSSTTGIVGGVMSNIDSTTAGALKNRLQTIKANIGFDKLQAMRDASPTGGALGQVSEFENRLLQSVYGSLAQSQKASDIMYNLQRLEGIYDRIINEGIPEDEARALYREEALRGAGVQGGGTASDAPEGVDADLWQYMTPEERQLWQN